MKNKISNSDLHPDLREVYGKLRSFPFHNRFCYELLLSVQNLLPKKSKNFPGIEIRDHALHSCRVRIYRRVEGAQRVGLLWVHGGGYIIGNVKTNDRECAAIAAKLGIVVVSVDYRLAPKYPFPAALTDCMDAWVYMLRSSGELGIDTNRIAIVGQSAGGGLVASLVQNIADSGGSQPAAQVLMYPMLDDRTASRRELDGMWHRLWNNKNNRAAWSWYLGQPAGMDCVPLYSVPARRGDLRGFPPTWIGVGDADLFYEEGVLYAKRLELEGVPCEFYIGPGCPHAFDLMAPEAPISQEFVQQYYRFLKSVLKLP